MSNKPILVRITTVPVSLKLLLTGQMKFMSQNGFKVLMSSADGPEIDELVSIEECEHFVFPFTRKISPLIDLVCLVQLILFLIKVKPTIVHTHTPKAGLIGMIASYLCRIEFRFHTIAGLPFETSIGFKRKLLLAMERMTYLCATHVLPNSDSMLKAVLANNLVRSKKLTIIASGSSNGIDLSRFSSDVLDPQRLLNIKMSIGYNSSNYYCIAIGRMVRDKGIIELIRCYKRLSEKHESIKLILLGPFEKTREKETLPSSIISEINSNPNIIHIDWTDDVEYYLEISDLLIHASHREGFPNVLLQAGAMKCPIVCSNINGNIDIVKDGVTGTLFEVNNEDDLFEHMSSILSTPLIIESYAEKLYTEIVSHYERNSFHNCLLKFYKDTLSDN